jgi:hypothetical protein
MYYRLSPEVLRQLLHAQIETDETVFAIKALRPPICNGEPSVE